MKRIVLYLLILYLKVEGTDLECFFKQYQRPVTLLDLCSFSSAYPSNYCVPDSIIVSFKQNIRSSEDRRISFNCYWNDKKLKLLAECEYFDVVLIPASRINQNNFLVIAALADYICIYCNENELKQIQSYIELFKKSSTLYQERAVEKSVYVVRTERPPCLIKRNICWHLHSDKTHQVISTFENKFLVKKWEKSDRIISSIWIPGINLMTFLFFGIGYPNKFQLTEYLNTLKKRLHYDWGPANMVLTDKGLTMIDFDDFLYDPDYSDYEHLQKVIEERTRYLLKMFDLSGNNLFYFYWNIYHQT